MNELFTSSGCAWQPYIVHSLFLDTRSGVFECSLRLWPDLENRGRTLREFRAHHREHEAFCASLRP